MRILLVFLLAGPAAWAQGTADVNVSVTYEDRPYTQTGFTAPPYPNLNVRYAEVELVRSSDETVLASGHLNASGTITFPGISIGETVFARIYSRTNLSGTHPIEVRNTPGGAFYTWAGTATPVSTDPTNIPESITDASGANGPFNILDMGVLSFDYLDYLYSNNPPPAPAPLRMFWYGGGSPGTYFDRNANEIYLLGKTVDSDEFDDDIILHEIGHYVAFHFSKDDSPGGPHAITGKYDVRLAWSEGFAHYWSGAARNWATGYAAPWGIVDTAEEGTSFFEFETPSFPNDTITAENELAVASILWDLVDTVQDAPDNLSGLDREVWTCLVEFKTPTPLDHISLEDFRARWKANNPTEYPVTFDPGGIADGRIVRYYTDPDDDPTPPNDDFNNATDLGNVFPINRADRTLFKKNIGVGDEDWYKIDLLAGPFTAETRNLRSGCDTVLELYDSSGTGLLASNDDRALNDFSSLVNMEITAPGVHYIRILAFVGTDANTENGSYDLHLESQGNYLPSITVHQTPPTNVSAPTPVTFDITATDPDGYVVFYEWDFDGDDFYEASSIEGGKITHVFDMAGSYTVALRITDNLGGKSYRNFPVTVTGPSADITLTAVFADAIVPATATFTFSVNGIVPATYEWDFDGNGSIDAASTRTNQKTHTYTEATSVIARGYVIDQSGRRYAAETEPLFVLVGATPPSISSFTVTGNQLNLPQKAFLSLSVPVDALMEWDVDGDGHFDRATVNNNSVPSFNLNHQYQRVGTLLPRVRVTESGLSSKLYSAVTITAPAATGWIIDPHDADTPPVIAGSSVTITAEALPRGINKQVQFQYRPNDGTLVFTDIGEPISSTGTRFSTTWDVTGLGIGKSYDLRILVNGSDPLLNDDDNVTVNNPSPDISESGTIKDILLSGTKTVFARNRDGVEIEVPYQPVTGILRIEPGEPESVNGSTHGMTLKGSPVRIHFVSGAGPFSKPVKIRIPIPSGTRESRLSIHRYDSAEGVWRRDYPSQVLHSDGLVEVRTVDTGTFAIFENKSGGGGGLCFGTVLSTGSPGPWILLALAASILLFLGGRWLFRRAAFITLEDTVIAAGSTATLVAWVERDLMVFWDPDLSGVEVEFLSEEGVIGTVITGNDGRAKLEVPGLPPGIHRFRARLSDGSRYHAPRVESYVGVFGEEEPVLVTDIDMTLARCSPFGFITKSNLSVLPLADSPLSVQKLSGKYRIIYLSARDHIFIPKTRAWLRMNGFPNGPLLLRRKRFTRASALEHKRERLQEVKSQLGGMRYGIGDKPHDVVAYHEQGIRPVWITSQENGQLPAETIKVSSWKEIMDMINADTA